MRMHHPPTWRRRASLATVLLVSFTLAACSGSGSDGAPGAPGAPGTPGASTGLLTGTVTNSATGLPVAGCPITLTPAVGTAPVTAADGTFSVTLPVGSYVVTCGGTADFALVTSNVSVLAGQTATLDFDMPPKAPVVVTITGTPTSPAPGATFTLTSVVKVLDGSTVQGYAWTQDAPTPAALGTPTAAATAVTLATGDAYKTTLLAGIEPLDRWRVVPISPHALSAPSTKTFTVTVTTTSGTYKASAKVVAKLPFAVWANGLLNVPIGLPVLLGGKDQASYTWSFTSKPGTSATVLNDASTRYPWFVPDVPGTYSVQVTDTTIAPPVAVHLDVYAGRWEGAIVGMDAEGHPTTTCVSMCHALYYPEKFTEWAKSGHAEIFSTNVNTSDHYGSGCFACHTVGFDTSVANNGFDDATQYAEFMAGMFPGGHMTADPGNWAKVLTEWPTVAQKANIQCENCHGPNGLGSAHVLLGTKPDPRISTAADVCGYCHGEPPRHGRYQQWEESGHGNFETAIGEGTQNTCNKCHSAQGFIFWQKSGFTQTLTIGTANPPPTANDVQPITCVVCHDPHAVGTVSGTTTDAPLRVEGDTPMLDAGFVATNVGKGAMCMTCHNARRGLVGDGRPFTSPDRAPHSGPQTDVLMGQNAFFVSVGTRSDHGWLTDTCVTCHVSLSPPPAEYSMPGNGTGHGFEADPAVCTKCHGSYDGGTLETWFEDSMALFSQSIATEIRAEMDALLARGYTLTLTHATGTVNVTATTVIGAVTATESHGRAAMDVVLDGTTYSAIQLSNAKIYTSLGASAGSLVSNSLFAAVGSSTVPQPELLGRSNWNYYLLHSDGSKGVHNPSFIEEIVNASLEVLSGLTWAAP